MFDERQRVRVEEIDWANLLPLTRLFGAFRMAIHPPKLVVGLLLVASLWLGGRTLSGLGATGVYSGEFDRYTALDREAFAQWLDAQPDATRDRLGRLLGRLPGVEAATRDAFKTTGDPHRFVLAGINESFEAKRQRLIELVTKDGNSLAEADHERLADFDRQRREMVRAVEELRPAGVFDALIEIEAAALDRLIMAASGLRFGFDQLLSRAGPDRATVSGAVYELMVTIPGWLWRAHCGFAVLFGAWALAVWSLLGGTLARMAALHATRDRRITPLAAGRFVAARWGWFVLTPLLPCVIAGLVGLAMALGGMVFFNMSVTSPIGGALLFLALFGGAIIAFLLLLQAAGMHLYFPALAVEGTDTFDAISRAFGYVVGRPWRWLLYNAAALVYGAITLMFVELVVFLTLWSTHRFVGVWAVRDAGQGGETLFETVFPGPQYGVPGPEGAWDQLNMFSSAGAALVGLWVCLVSALVTSFAVSFYFSANTWVYLLLRRAADGAEFDDVFEDEDDDELPIAATTTEHAPAKTEQGKQEPAANGDTPTP